MNNGAFGENFPYSNFHDLNMDWIIKIAKDFLDQYTNIQQTITDGLESLDSKAEELEALLQQWYDTHSDDIANQLADALTDLNNWYTTHVGYLDQYVTDSIALFNQSAEAKGAEVIASIPQDYTALSDSVDEIIDTLSLEQPASVLTTTYNPNPGNEGNLYPAGDYGIGSAYWDVSEYAGKTIMLSGDELGWCMLFSDTISPSDFLTKEDANHRKAIFFTLPSDTKYLTANEFIDTSKLFIVGTEYLERNLIPNSVNMLIRDSMTWTVSASTTTNFYADVYLEHGKTYNISRLGTGLDATKIDIETFAGTVLLNIQGYTSLGFQKTFTWNNKTGWFKYHHITGSSGYENPENIANTLMIWETQFGNWDEISYSAGIRNTNALWANKANDSIKLEGRTTKEIIDIARHTDSLNITCIGDSLMQGVGAPAYNIVNQLNSNFLTGTGRTAYRYAVGGESSWRIACRIGGLGTSIMPVTIPGDTTPVEATFIDSNYETIIFGEINGLLFGVGTVWIDDIECQVTVSQARDRNYIARKTAGSEIVIARPTLIYTEVMENHRNDIFVIWAGTNDNITLNNIQNTFDHIDSIINMMNSNRYIIMGMTSSTTIQDIDAINEKFSAKYGSKFLNIKQYLIRYGMSDNSLSDPTYTLDGYIPDQLLDDAVHFNRYGYYSCAKAIYNMIVQSKY